MQSLREALRGAVSGELRVSVLAGPAGIGKTRTAMELVREALTLDVGVHLARCWAGDGATPFWPWIQLLRSCLTNNGPGALLPKNRDVLRRLAWIVPELAEADPAEGHRDLDRQEARSRLFEAIGIFFRELAKTRPLLVFIDDVHWADEASLRLLEFLIETLQDGRVHLVAAFRDDEVGAEHALTPVLGAMVRRAGTERIDLSGLSKDSVVRMLQAAARREPIPSFVDKVMAATAGNPFFISEVVRLISDGELDVTATGAQIPLLARVRDFIRLHLRSRTPACREMLKIASVVGREIDLLPVARTFGRPQGEILDLFDEALAAGLLARVADKAGCYLFVHDLVRETLYRDLASSERARIHRRMGEALETLGGADRLAETAYHYCEAAPEGAADKAIAYAQRAAERASSLMAFEDSVAHYDRALGVLPLLTSRSPDLECRILLSQAEAACGTREQAPDLQARFARAAAAARAVGSAELLARAALGHTGYDAGEGDYRNIIAIDTADIDLLSEADSALGNNPSALKALVLARLALAIQYAKKPHVSEALSSEAVTMARAHADSYALANVLRCRYEIVSGPDFVHERLDLGAEILRIAEELRSRPLQIDGFFFLSRSNLEFGNLAAAVENGVSAARLAATMRQPGAKFRSGVAEVASLTMRGEFAVAAAKARQFFERDAPHNLGAPGSFASQMCWIHWLKGEHLDAIHVMQAELERPIIYKHRHLRYALAVQFAAVGRTEEARRELEDAARDDFAEMPRDQTLLANVWTLAELTREFGDRARARRLYEIGLPFEHFISVLLGTVCHGSHSRALGLLAHVFGDYQLAQTHFETRSQSNDSSTHRPSSRRRSCATGACCSTLAGATRPSPCSAKR